MKPKISYAEFSARKRAGTVAWVIEKYIDKMNATQGKELGTSQMYTLRGLQRAPIGSVAWAELAKANVIAHAQARIESGVCAATVNQDITYLSGALNYAGSNPAWPECDGCSAAAITAARPFMVKHNLVGKSTPRDRRPSPEEIERLVAYFNTPKSHGFARRLPMERMTRWQLASGRRIGESCRLLWSDWNREDRTILVRKMKDPRNRDKNKLVALPEEAQAMLEALWETRSESEARIFPLNAKSVGAAYTNAKKALGIVNLHLHDSRRDCGTRLVEDKGFTSAEAILVTGHETPAVFERTYLRQDPALLKNGPRSKREATI